MGHRARWTRNELMRFLEKMANELQQNLLNESSPSYDGLVVLYRVTGSKGDCGQPTI